MLSYILIISLLFGIEAVPSCFQDDLAPRYIIKFDNYRPIKEHWSTIRSFLGPPQRKEKSILLDKTIQTPSLKNSGIWKPVGIRNHHAMDLPTDFVVISLIQPEAKDSILYSLKHRLHHIKDIFLDSTLRTLSVSPTLSSTNDTFNENKENKIWPQSTLPIRKSWAFDHSIEDNIYEKNMKKKSKSKLSKILEKKIHEENHGDIHSSNSRKLNQKRGGGAVKGTVTSKEASELHKKGLSGQNVKVAVFDTGIHDKHPHFKNIVERINWTDDHSLYDTIGHGTFVAGVICSSNEQCPGWAPDVDLYTFRVFTSKQVSYTSWFLDAFNYAIFREIDVLNLSIGGPDHADRPFVEKIWEMTANGIIVVSAIGNDGPLYGTLNNPADQYDTIGVGGLANNGAIAKFSSRGMSLWELPFGYGRFKPDITAMGSSVIGSKMLDKKTGTSGCRALSGTSVASPVIAGAVALLLSDVRPSDVIQNEILTQYKTYHESIGSDMNDKLQHGPKDGIYNIRRLNRISPAAMKQVLVESADPFHRSHIFEQGAGRLNISYAHELLTHYKPHASFLPASLITSLSSASSSSSSSSSSSGSDQQKEGDYKPSECLYMWPYCTQPLYTGSVPYVFNLTLINGLGVSGEVESIRWTQTKVQQTSSSSSPHHDVSVPLLFVHCEHSSPIWPWSGYFAVSVSATASAYNFHGVVGGVLEVTVSGVDEFGVSTSQELKLPIEVDVIETPPRHKRILWDQFHSIGYPSGYFPRDDLKVQNDMLDWTGDHIHTNFKVAYEALRERGYYVEVLSEDFTCFDANEYGTLLIIDPEEEFFELEIEKIEKDVREKGLSLIVFADWYSVNAMKKVAFFDDNTRSQWTAVTGGSNVPALNDLLSPFGVGFSDRIFDGSWTLSRGNQIAFQSGVSIAKFPKHSWLRKTSELKERDSQKKGLRGNSKKEKVQTKSSSSSSTAAETGIENSKEEFTNHITTTPPHILGCFDVCESSSTGCASSSNSIVNHPHFHIGSKIIVYGDSSCLDSWQGGPLCLDLLAASVAYASKGERSELYFRNEDYISEWNDKGSGGFIEDINRPPPQRMTENELFKYSNVLSSPGFQTHHAGDSCTWRDRLKKV